MHKTKPMWLITSLELKTMTYNMANRDIAREIGIQGLVSTARGFIKVKNALMLLCGFATGVTITTASLSIVYGIMLPYSLVGAGAFAGIAITLYSRYKNMDKLLASMDEALLRLIDEGRSHA